MEIKINGQTADISLENEKTLAEVLSSLNKWIENSGLRLSGISVNGKVIDENSIENEIKREIDTVNVLDIETKPLADFYAMSLLSLLDDMIEYESLNFEEKNKFLENWKESAEAKFSNEQMPDLYLLYVNTFSGSGLSCGNLRSLTEERLREVREPAEEMARLKQAIDDICTRLVDLPLDIQTGKDKRASETIQFFSGITEKIFRIFKQLGIQGYIKKTLDTEEAALSKLIEGFGQMVKEFLEAYEKHDSVLVGDIAEYEIAPGLLELYNTLVNSSLEPAAGVMGAI